MTKTPRFWAAYWCGLAVLFGAYWFGAAAMASEPKGHEHHDHTTIVTNTVVKHDRDKEAAAALIGAGVAYWVYHYRHNKLARERVAVARINERMDSREHPR